MKLVILDRDGTINEDRPQYVQSPDDWVPLPGSLEAIAQLNHAGWHVVLATNQAGLGRGLFDMAVLNAIHTRMHKRLGAVGARVDAIFFCPHTPEDKCHCRKPEPGLFEQIAQRFNVDMRQVPAVGDSLRDVQAAAAAGCPTHLVLTGKAFELKGHPLPAQYPSGTQVHENLAAFVQQLLQNTA
jgi:D-glycero-D-manno-heptose 1,7-bisphosphate phosphatase